MGHGMNNRWGENPKHDDLDLFFNPVAYICCPICGKKSLARQTKLMCMKLQTGS
jgi:hypothetical protein